MRGNDWDIPFSSECLITDSAKLKNSREQRKDSGTMKMRKGRKMRSGRCWWLTRKPMNCWARGCEVRRRTRKRERCRSDWRRQPQMSDLMWLWQRKRKRTRPGTIRAVSTQDGSTSEWVPRPEHDRPTTWKPRRRGKAGTTVLVAANTG